MAGRAAATMTESMATTNITIESMNTLSMNFTDFLSGSLDWVFCSSCCLACVLGAVVDVTSGGEVFSLSSLDNSMTPIRVYNDCILHRSTRSMTLESYELVSMWASRCEEWKISYLQGF